MTDPAESMIAEQGRRAQAIVGKADFSRCNAGPEMKDVYRFLVDGMVAMLEAEAVKKAEPPKSVIGATIAGGGIGGMILLAVEMFCRAKGWL